MHKLSDEKLKIIAVVAGIAVSVVLLIIKAMAAFLTGSLSVISSLIDSLADVFSSLISLIAVYYSNLPFDKKHRYGYGKAESLSALFQAAFIFGSGGFVLYDGINRFISPISIKNTDTGITVMIVSLILTIGLIAFQYHVAKKTNSLAIKAESVHYTVDILTNASIIISLAAVKYFHWLWIDVATALVIAAYLMKNAAGLAYEAFSQITDKEADEEVRLKIADIVQTVDEVKGFHDLRTRISGAKIFIELHLELDGKITLFAAHKISDKAEAKIAQEFPNARILIHQDPYGIKENRLDDEIKGSCRL